MTPRRIIRAAILSCLIGLAINLVLAIWLAWRAPGVTFGVNASVLPQDALYSVLRQSTTGKTTLTIRRTGPNPVSLSALRNSFVERLPDGIVDAAVGDFPSSPTRQARLMFPRWSTWATRGPAGDFRTIRAAGFPFPTLMTREGQDAAGAPYTSGLLYRHPRDPQRFIPCIPIFEGILFNSALFAAPWFILLLYFPILRRRIRQRSGHCPYCNYDLRGNLPAGCSECGWNRDVPGATPVTMLLCPAAV